MIAYASLVDFGPSCRWASSTTSGKCCFGDPTSVEDGSVLTVSMVRDDGEAPAAAIIACNEDSALFALEVVAFSFAAFSTDVVASLARLRSARRASFASRSRSTVEDEVGTLARDGSVADENGFAIEFTIGALTLGTDANMVCFEARGVDDEFVG